MLKTCWKAALIICVFASGLGAVLEAQTWRVVQETDSMTDAVDKVAVAKNADGHSLTVWRAQDRKVWAAFRLSASSSEVFGSDLPIYRVDKLRAEKLEDMVALQKYLGDKNTLPTWLIAKPKWIIWQIESGETGELKRDSSLAKLMTGGRVLFRYFLFTGGVKETSFQLDGATAAIESACDVKLLPPDAK